MKAFGLTKISKLSFMTINAKSSKAVRRYLISPMARGIIKQKTGILIYFLQENQESTTLISPTISYLTVLC